MHCYLHIGTEKTGTTLIQEFLRLNSKPLESLGLVTLKTAGYPSNRWLVLAAYDLDRRDRWTHNKNINSDEDMRTVQAALNAGFNQELANKAISSLVVSSEHIQSRLTRPTEVSRLKLILESLGVTSFSVILYLRDPAEAAAALYSTSIKCGSKNASPPFPDTAGYQQICNHRATIELFSSVFGVENLQLRLFEKSFLVNNSVLDDFLALLAVNKTTGFQAPSHENKSLSTVGLELLRRINERIPNLDEEKRLALRTQIIAYLEKYFSDEKYQLPATVYLAYEQTFNESNEWVRKRFFPERSTLFASKSSLVTTNSSFDFKELDKIANLLADIWLEREKDLI